MASTNKTTNYDLSQYIGTDKPTYLGDYNSDMMKIDTAMAENKTSAQNAENIANNAVATAGNAQTTATAAQQTANTAKDTADGLASAVSQAQTTANNAETNIEKLNLINFDKYTATSSQGTVSGQVTVATNSDGTVGKIYGEINLSQLNYQGFINITIPNTKLRPTEDIVIENLGIAKLSTSSDLCAEILKVNVNISTNGTISISRGSTPQYISQAINLMPCLLFMKNFGDVDNQVGL